MSQHRKMEIKNHNEKDNDTEQLCMERKIKIATRVCYFNFKSDIINKKILSKSDSNPPRPHLSGAF